jgi:uncharacterized repeat protein (TIGR01451 family)
VAGVVRADGVNNSAVLDGFIITAGDGSSGSGLYARNSSPTLRNLTFQGNRARFGPGLYGQNSRIISPTATSAATAPPATATGRGCTCATAAAATLERVSFSGNQAGSISQGGGVYLYQSSLTMTNSLFSGNSATTDSGGGLYLAESNARLTNVSFGGNYAGTSGAGIKLVINSSAVLTNVILWGNGGSSQVSKDSSSSITLNHTIVEGGCPAGASCTNPVSGNPRFVAAPDPAGAPSPAGDMRLLPGSAAINAGTNSGAPADDIRGVARPVAGAADLGAYESRGFSLTYGGGSGQFAIVGNAFANPLTVTVSSAAGEPVGPSGQVTFSGPASGASLLNSPLIAETDANGVATALVSANSITGSYVVSATANGVLGQPAFVLTNSAASLLLSKQVTPLEAIPGQTVTYTLAFTNNGAAPVTGLVITDFISNITVQQVISSGAVAITRTSGATAETFALADLPPDGSGIITLTARLVLPLAAGPLQNTATISSPNISGGNTEQALAQVTVLNVSPVITGATLTAAESEANGTVIGVVTATDNNGDALDYTIISGDPGDAFSVAGNGDIVINNNSLLNYERATQHILTVLVSDGQLTATTLVTVQLTNVDTDLTLAKAVRTATAVDDWRPVPREYLAIPGDLLTYTLTFENVGEDDATGVVITDALPTAVDTTERYRQPAHHPDRQQPAAMDCS